MRLLLVILNVLDVSGFILTFVTFQHLNLIYQGAVIVFLVFPHYDHLGRLEIANCASELLYFNIRYCPRLCAVPFSPVKYHVAPLSSLIFTELALPYVMCWDRVLAVVQLLVPFQELVGQRFVIT